MWPVDVRAYCSLCEKQEMCDSLSFSIYKEKPAEKIQRAFDLILPVCEVSCSSLPSHREPPARVPYAENVPRTFSATLLRLWKQKSSALCGERPKALPLETANL